MDIEAYRENIKLQLTGGLLDLELEDSTLDKIINTALIELQRYICTVEYATIDFDRCIDTTKLKDQFGKDVKIAHVSRVFRAKAYAGNEDQSTGMMDPMYVSQWQILSGTGNLYNFQDYALNYASWNTLLQIRNTISTDLSFRYDRVGNRLYVNISNNPPSKITIEYIRRYDNVSEVVSDYWIDNLLKLSLALAKVALGRIRTRYSQSNALWQQDGETLLQEGNQELESLRDYLRTNTQLVYAYD